MRNKGIAVICITAAVFAAYAFLIPFEKNASFWVAFGFELLALALQIPIFKTAFSGANDLKSKVLGFPIARVGYIYLGVQTALSLALLPLGFIPIPVGISLFLCILVLGVALICSISAVAARETVEKIEATVKPDTGLMMDLRTRSAQLVNKTSDPAVKKQLETLAENIRFSDPVSSPEIAESEQKLTEAFAQLEAAVGLNSSDTADICKVVQAALDDRNTACRMNKKR